MIWECKIGCMSGHIAMDGADFFMREAVKRVYKEITGKDAEFTFSGWGAELDESEAACLKLKQYEDTPAKGGDLMKARIEALEAKTAMQSSVIAWQQEAIANREAENQKLRADAAMLDFLDAKGTGWIAGDSTTGRGYGVHVVASRTDTSVREAIRKAIKNV